MKGKEVIIISPGLSMLNRKPFKERVHSINVSTNATQCNFRENVGVPLNFAKIAIPGSYLRHGFYEV